MGLTIAMLIGLVCSYMYFLTYGAMARVHGQDGSESSKFYNNIESPYSYNYQGVLGMYRLGVLGRDLQ
jgi:hypothetical protein